MILSGHQPNYWPYPGLIGKIMKSDCFMFVTKVQFEKKKLAKTESSSNERRMDLYSTSNDNKRENGSEHL